MRIKKQAYLALSVLCIIFLVSCAMQSSHRKSSVVDYLYPERDEVVEAPSVPVLKLPLRVGIAFVPETSDSHRRYGALPEFSGSGLAVSEKDRTSLMKKVREEFRKYPFVKSIDIIPSAYLTPKGSFKNLDQIKTMFGLDVVVLLSYDQVQHTDEGSLSMAYWTIVGAYIVKGEKNETSTMVDSVVYDIDSKKMLFRAPGISHIQNTATLVNLNEQLRLDSRTGFDLAVGDLIVNLKEQLELFKDKVKESPRDYKIIETPEYKEKVRTTSSGYGGGALDGASILISLALGGALLVETRRGG